jgi:siroheme synthase-like protein
MQAFLAGLSVYGRACLVLGGDAEAEDKARRLHEAGARLSVVSDTVTPEFQGWMREQSVVWTARPWDARDLTPAPFLVFSALRDEATSRALFVCAERERFLLCCVDQPTYSNFTNVAFGRCGPLAYGIASGGAAPALAKRVREDLARGFGPELAAFAEHLADLRARTAPEARRGVMRAALEGFGLEVRVRLPAAWREGRS